MSSIASCDVCDINRIYNKEYEYFLPKSVLESFLCGNAFDNKNTYSQEESLQLHEDINALFQKILSSNLIKERVAVITAGAPGAGKTVKLCQDLEEKRCLGKHYAYVCPDDVCLKNLSKTYLRDIEKNSGSREAAQAAYDKWRPASNAATHLILSNLIRKNYAFYFGSTSSGPSTYKFFDFLKKQGYHIKLIHITAPDEVRWESIKERDKTFIQTTQQDIKEKGLLLPQRISDTFLAYADEIEFYYRGDVKEDAKLAALWIRNVDSQEGLGTLKIVDPSKYNEIKTIHDIATKFLNRPDLKWESTIEKNSNMT